MLFHIFLTAIVAKNRSVYSCLQHLNYRTIMIYWEKIKVTDITLLPLELEVSKKEDC